MVWGIAFCKSIYQFSILFVDMFYFFYFITCMKAIVDALTLAWVWALGITV